MAARRIESSIDGSAPFGAVLVLRARHGARLASDVLWMARATRAWWLVALAALAAFAIASAGAAQAAVPYAVYTFF